MLWFILTIYLTMSAITFVVYGYDKRAARLGRWRIRESTLQVLALLGGWPGAAVAQGLFRHKRRKRGFMAVFLMIGAAHVGLCAWLVMRGD